MRTKKINIDGKEITLFERTIGESEDLENFMKTTSFANTGINTNIYYAISLLRSALKSNIPAKPIKPKWYHFLKKRRWKELIKPINELEDFISYKNLREKLSINDLDELVKEVYLLEGIDVKKKVDQEAESESEEKSESGS